MDESELVKRSDQIHCHTAKGKNIDDWKEQPQRVGRFSSDDFTPLHKINTGDQPLDRIDTRLRKKQIKTDTQKEIGNKKENKNTHVDAVLLCL
jgi:hypothetical protein